MLEYEINKDNFTAKVISSPNAENDVFIQRFIIFENVEYLVTSITEGSFWYNNKIKSIQFPKNSALISIEADSFTGSSLVSINIPSSIESLQDGWCNGTQNLTKIQISPENKHYKFLDESNQIIVEKNNNNFDSIVFACRDITNVIIPKYIKNISSYAFQYCQNLKNVEIPVDSELRTIQKEAFYNTSIIRFVMPKKVIQFDNTSFNNCNKLELFEIKEGSELQSIPDRTFNCIESLKTVILPEKSSIKTIGKYCFSVTNIESIFIPESIQKLKEGWCNSFIKSVIISPKNKYYGYLDEKHQMISKIKNGRFESLVLALHNITFAKIPKSIKCIKAYAFQYCEKLNTILFENDSELCSIKRQAFYLSSIEHIIIPKRVVNLVPFTFSCMRKLKSIEFLGESLISKEDFNDENYNLFLISIPNAKSVNFPAFSFGFFDHDIIIFLNAGAENNFT